MSRQWTAERRQKRRDGRKTSHEDGKHRAQTNSRQQRVCRLVCLLFRGDPVWYRMIYREIAHIPYHAISQDTIRRDIVRASIPRTLRNDTGIVSRRNIVSRYWILLIVSTWYYASRRNDHAHRTGEGTHKKMETKHRPWTDDDGVKHCLTLPKITSKMCPRLHTKRGSVWVVNFFPVLFSMIWHHAAAGPVEIVQNPLFNAFDVWDHRDTGGEGLFLRYWCTRFMLELNMYDHLRYILSQGKHHNWFRLASW